MSLGKFLTSRVFFIQIAIALLIVISIVFLFMHWLTYATNHDNVITVPDFRKMSVEQVEEKLDKLDLEYVLLDTVDYHPEFPKMSVVEQDPIAGSQVKEGRKIYIKINDNGYTSVKLPNLIQQTYRQVVPTLKALGLSEGQIIYVPNIGKDMVLEIKMDGKTLKAGDKILKSSKIDLVLGDGKVAFDETQLDSLNVEEKPINEQ